MEFVVKTFPLQIKNKIGVKFLFTLWHQTVCFFAYLYSTNNYAEKCSPWKKTTHKDISSF